MNNMLSGAQYFVLKQFIKNGSLCGFYERVPPCPWWMYIPLLSEFIYERAILQLLRRDLLTVKERGILTITPLGRRVFRHVALHCGDRIPTNL